MKRLIPILVLATPMVLAACNQGASVNARNASVAEVAEKAQDAIRMQAGEWVMKTEILAMAMPGMKDPNMVAMMKDSLAKQKIATSTTCISAEDAARPPARMFAGDASANCKYEHFTMGGGKIDAVLNCGAAGPDDVSRHSRMAMSGTLSSNAIDMVTEVSGGSGETAMNMKSRLQGKWVGACKPGKEKAG